MFDVAYDIPLAIFNSASKADGLALKLRSSCDAFWMSPSDETWILTIVDFVFIDEFNSLRCLYLVHEKLAARSPVMLDRLVKVFDDFGSNISWIRGKTAQDPFVRSTVLCCVP